MRLLVKYPILFGILGLNRKIPHHLHPLGVFHLQHLVHIEAHELCKAVERIFEDWLLPSENSRPLGISPFSQGFL